MSARPFRTLLPQGLSPLLLTCEHASDRLPAGLARDRAARAALRTHWGSDIGAWEVARGLSARLRATAVGARWSRLLIDLNRPAGDPTLIRSHADGVPLPWNRDLTPEDVARRLRAYHAPFHDEIDRLLIRRLVRGVRPLLVAVHTFTAVFGRSRRGFDAGVLYVNERALARRLGDALRRQGMSVRYNQPYSGLEGYMYSTHRHATHHRLPCLEIEVNQGRLASRAGVARAIRAIARALPEVVAHTQEPAFSKGRKRP